VSQWPRHDQSNKTAGKEKKRKARKKRVARTPPAVKVHKVMFLEALAKGCGVADAAKAVDIARCTAYKWRKEDSEFDAAWQDAVETGVDHVETAVYNAALDGNMVAAKLILKHRRRESYGDTNNQQTNNVTLNITLAEHEQRMERMGLLVPQIETDYDDDEQVIENAPAGTEINHP
jgi:hypothetical protein